MTTFHDILGHINLVLYTRYHQFQLINTSMILGIVASHLTEPCNKAWSIRISPCEKKSGELIIIKSVTS